MTIAFLFPGQGSQQPGMLHALPAYPETEATLDEASEVLGRDVRELDEESVLESTIATQVAIYVAGVAVTRCFAAEGVIPVAVAGLSVGAYAAATACGALPFRDGVRLVHLRASLTAEAFPGGYGLSAIVGLDEAQVAALVARCHSPEHPVFVGNLNAPRQIVVAGSIDGMEMVLALARGSGCTKAERLAVRIPSHCALFAPVAEKMFAEARTLEPAPVRAQYITNRRARPTRSFDKIIEDIATNIAYSVRWHDSTQVLAEMGATLFLEPSPGNVLSSLAGAAFPHLAALSVSANDWSYVVKTARATGAVVA